MNVRGERRPKTGPWMRPLRVAPIAAAVAIAVLASALANREAARIVTGASALDGVLGTMEARFAVSHIRVEEKVAGDRTVDVARDVDANQADAARLCRILRDGGPTRQGHVERIDDSQLTPLANRICRGVDAFRRLTAARLVAPAAVKRAGSAAETRYDSAFAAVLRDADAARGRLEDIGARQRHRLQLVGGAIVLVLCALIVAAGVVIRRRDRQLAAAAHEREGVLQSAGEGILALDRDGTVQFANAAAAGLLGWPPDELRGRPVG